jgi:hypothetical protein
MKGVCPMNVKEFGNLSLFMVFLLILAVIPLGCSAKKSITKADMKTNGAVTMQSSLDRIRNVLKLNPDGTVSLDEKKPDYASLNRGDSAFGKSVLASLNTMVKDGMVRVNPDFSVNWLIQPSRSAKFVGKTNCKSHWWGETCFVDGSTTKKVCTGLEGGEGALIICGFIPVVDVACEIIEVVGAIPLEVEICPCAHKGDSSTFHVTWIGAAWFTCN